MLLGAMAGGKTVEATALGNPLTFITDVSKPLKSLLIPFTPVQSGTGDPSPQNIRSILPWNGLTVQQAGKNLLSLVSVHALPNGNDINSYGTRVSVSDGIVTITQSQTTTDYEVRNYRNGYFVIRFDGFKDLLQKTKMRFSAKINVTSNPLQSSCLYFAPNGIVDVEAPINDGIVSGVVNQKFDGTKDYLEIRCAGCSFTMTDIMLYPYSETDPTFEPYEGRKTDIVFPSLVYGGSHEAVSGKLMSEFVPVDLSTMGFTYRSGWNCWVANADSRFETVASNNTPTRALTAEAKAVGASGYTSSHPANTFSQNTNGVWFFDNGSTENPPSGILIVPLATPTEQTLTGHQITALKGENTIWSDADGSMTAVYLKKK